MNEIETANFTLRPYKEKDFEAIHAYSADPDVCRFMEWGPNTVRETKQFLQRSILLSREKSRQHYDFAITLKGDDVLMGSIGLMIYDATGKQAFLGYVLGKPYWSRGVMSEAVGGIFQFGFENLNLHRLSASCDVQNVPSYRVMEKCGMRREGLFIEDKYIKGRWRDTLVYSILASEWRERQAK